MDYILSHPGLIKRAKLLAQSIYEIQRNKGSKMMNIEAFSVPHNQYNCIIRYGNSSPVGGKETEFNRPEHIRMAGNKLRLSIFLTEKDIPHVQIGTQNNPQKYPVVVRTELNRGGGIGIVICENEQQYNKYRGYAWSYWYNFKFELGVHVLGGEIKRVFKKIREENLEEEKYPIRNTQRGYSFKLRELDHYKGLIKYVKSIYEVLPIQFCRMDIGYVEDEGYKLIEINSAPDLSQNHITLNLYAEFLANKIYGG